MTAVVPIKATISAFSRDAEPGCSRSRDAGAWGKDITQLLWSFLVRAAESTHPCAPKTYQAMLHHVPAPTARLTHRLLSHSPPAKCVPQPFDGKHHHPHPGHWAAPAFPAGTHHHPAHPGNWVLGPAHPGTSSHGLVWMEKLLWEWEPRHEYS